ncbi:MAG: SAM-dependent chlorinase/fluorinase [Balneolaceae bacterium]
MRMSRIVTLTTDFGLQDHYVGTVKAVILGIAPDVRLVDISHEIPAQDVMAGAWVVRNAVDYFPAGTVHLVVVDPGVGTDRNPVAIEIGNQFFVGPDNGIFTLIADKKPYRACKLTNRAFWRDTTSNTFHGRDVFGPVAAHLASGVPLMDLGEPADELTTYRWATPIADKAGIQGWIVHIDHFGNLISNIPEHLVGEALDTGAVKIYVGNTILHETVSSYGHVEDGEPAAYIGSSGMLEIAINKGNASEMLSVRKGAQISVVLQK